MHLKQQMDANQTIGPRVFPAGVIDGRGPYSAPTNVLADTENEARAAIDRYAANGYIQIKIYSPVKPALVPFNVRTAHAKGMRVSGQVPAGMIASEFVDAGVDELAAHQLSLSELPSRGGWNHLYTRPADAPRRARGGA
jgi:hypothetical protein